MKRVVALVIVLMLGVVAFADDYEAGLLADMAAQGEITERAEEAINYFHVILYGSELSSVTVNPNFGTDEAGDFVALVYMNYVDQHDASYIDRDVAIRVSNTIAEAIQTDCPEIVELAVFWTFVKYDAQAKVAFTIDDEGINYADAMFPKFMLD